MLERAARSSLPFSIDNPAKAKNNHLDIREIFVDLYNGQNTLNLRSGSCKPIGTAIMGTNFGPVEKSRYEQVYN